jgi:hypothetical protein
MVPYLASAPLAHRLYLESGLWSHGLLCVDPAGEASEEAACWHRVTAPAAVVI